MGKVKCKTCGYFEPGEGCTLTSTARDASDVCILKHAEDDYDVSRRKPKRSMNDKRKASRGKDKKDKKEEDNKRWNTTRKKQLKLVGL